MHRLAWAKRSAVSTGQGFDRDAGFLVLRGSAVAAEPRGRCMLRSEIREAPPLWRRTAAAPDISRVRRGGAGGLPTGDPPRRLKRAQRVL